MTDLAKAKGIAAGYTDHDLTGAGTNYINAYFNTDGALGTKDGTTLVYGENGVGGAYQFSFNADDFVEVFFAIEAPHDGNIMIDFRGMVEGLTIKDVECHTAEEVYDDRIANDRIAYFKKYLADGSFEGKDADLQEYIQAVEDALAANASPTDMATHMENLENSWGLFVEDNFSNVLDLIPTTDGSSNTGNNSANWMNWVSKWNKLSSDYNGKAPWTWTTDRWGHKTAAANAPMQIQWQRKASGDWNNIATLTATLEPGTYYWGVTGQGGMMTLDKARWARSWANENAATQLFFNGDTTEVFILNAARREDYVYEYKLEEETEITLGIRCNTTIEATNGFFVKFYSPVLYKLKVEGELTYEETSYLSAVQTQLEAFKARLDVAYGHLAEANDTLPWGKEALKAGTDEAQARYDAWLAMDQDAVLEMLSNGETLGDTIAANGINVLNNDYIKPFEAMNKPFTDMPGAVAAAEETMGLRIYSSSSKMADLQASIDASKAMYAEKLKVPFSSEDSLALVNQRLAMADMVEAFKLAIDATVLVDIDFGTQEAPVKFNIHTAVDTAGVEVKTYTIDGAKGTMTFTDVTGAAADGTEIAGGSYPYMLGYNNADSLGMLRVGNSEATVAVPAAPVTGGLSIALGVGLATGVGAGSKLWIKSSQAKKRGEEYTGKDVQFDLITGAVSGILAPFTGGAGSAVGKTVAVKCFGMQVFKQTGKELVEEGVTTGFKQGFKNAMLNAAGYEYKGKLLGRIVAYGSEMATDGALSGMVENGFRTAYEGGDAKEVLGASISGFGSGLVLSPVIGGGMRGAGKVTRMFFGKSPDIDAPTRSGANDVDAPARADNTKPQFYRRS